MCCCETGLLKVFSATAALLYFMTAQECNVIDAIVLPGLLGTHYPPKCPDLLSSHQQLSNFIGPPQLDTPHTAAGQTALYESIGRHEALWTFDITASTWTRRAATGALPEPHLACALTVVKGQAYALVNDPEGTKRLEVYQLDLEKWEWRRVAPLGTQPSCRRAASAVIMQVATFSSSPFQALVQSQICSSHLATFVAVLLCLSSTLVVILLHRIRPPAVVIEIAVCSRANHLYKLMSIR